MKATHVNATTSERGLATVEKQRAALELRKAGLDFDTIARKVGYKHRASAYRAVMAALKKMLQEPADEVRKMEVARLDAMIFAIWSDVKRGNLNAMDRAIKIMDRRARLLGLDLQKIEHSGGITVEVEWTEHDGNSNHTQEAGKD